MARAERSSIALRAILGYAALLALVLLVPLPGPDLVKVLLIAVLGRGRARAIDAASGSAADGRYAGRCRIRLNRFVVAC